MNGRLGLPRTDLTAMAIGVGGTALTVLLVDRVGTPLGIGVLLGVTVFVAIVGAWVAIPHVAVAATIPFFVAVPTLKVFVHPLVGATKDLVVLAAFVAAAIVFFRRRAARHSLRADLFTLVLVAFILLLYLANLGGATSGETGYGAEWFHGVRLISEPLLLLLVGLALRDRRRTLRWGGISLALTAVAMALLGLAQQALGVGGLLELGYEYGAEVRQTSAGYLRSFGTLTEPFSYAAFLLFGLAAVLLWVRRRSLAYMAAPVLALGLAVSFVQTAALAATALIGLALAQRGHLRFAFLLVLAAVTGAVTVLAFGMQEPSTRLVQVSPNQYLTLNGRTQLWQEELGTERSNWILGRGVGATGTASQRAQETLTGAERQDAGEGAVVDSGYLALVADVGLLGLGLVLALLLRLVVLAWQATRRGDRTGWLALGLLTAIVIDALTRESLTGFPTAHIVMLLVGLALGTWQGRSRPAAVPAPAL